MFSSFSIQHSILLCRNIVRAVFDFYPVYVENDIIIAECLIKPMFILLNELISNDANESDIKVCSFTS